MIRRGCRGATKIVILVPCPNCGKSIPPSAPPDGICAYCREPVRDIPSPGPSPLADVTRTIRIVREDMAASKALHENADSPTNRRTYVRAAWTFAEVLANGFRITAAYALEARLFGDDGIGILDMYPLLDDEARLTDSGKLKLPRSRIPIKNLFAYSLRVRARCSGVDADQIFNDSGWEAFQDFLALRNRLTHPRTESDLDVTDRDLVVVREATDWLMHVGERFRNARPDGG